MGLTSAAFTPLRSTTTTKGQPRLTTPTLQADLVGNDQSQLVGCESDQGSGSRFFRLTTNGFLIRVGPRSAASMANSRPRNGFASQKQMPGPSQSYSLSLGLKGVPRRSLSSTSRSQL